MARPAPSKTTLFLLILLTAGLAGGYAAWRLRPAELPPGLVSGNGRLEATEVDVATKVAGRLATLTPREGDPVVRGQVLATLDADELAAQLRAAGAQTVQARAVVREAQAGVRKASVDAELARRTLQRTQSLVQRGFVSGDRADRDDAALQGAEAQLAAARVRVAEAGAAVEAALAREASLRATLDDTALRAPIDGRVLYRLAEPGEVLAAGGKALTLLDLGDVFMTVFLPTAEAGRVALGSPARIVLDALPGQVLPATVSFVAPRAQFTPREVETRSEREKLMFRVKLRVDPAWLAAHADWVKGGMPGVGYLRLDEAQPWPDFLRGE
ncbi:MAG: efflux RND transporter periplasmic adaptor subunit [Proteobacteria bacterium]|nr:efflux RND transporter periplasmic adaptor subunit [Pseudomonadota bacterium]